MYDYDHDQKYGEVNTIIVYYSFHISFTLKEKRANFHTDTKLFQVFFLHHIDHA